MGSVADKFNEAFRDHETDGDVASGVYNPQKSEIRAIGGVIETELGALSAGVLTYDTKAALDADTGQADDALAYVLNDATAANNGLYQFTAGAPGSWAQSTLQFIDDAQRGAADGVASLNGSGEVPDGQISETAVAQHSSAIVGDLSAEILRAGRAHPIEPIQVGSRWLQPTELSFDLYVIAGFWIDTGEAYVPESEEFADVPWRLEQSATRLDLFQRRANGAWIRFRIDREQDADRNQDVWHMMPVYAMTRVNGAWVEGDQITAPGELEIAIKESGKDDFMGGSAHGNQDLFKHILLVDGEEITLGLSGTYEANRVELIVRSYLFRYGTTGTPFEPSPTIVATVSTRWDFAEDGFFYLHHWVDWAGAYSIEWAYLAMLPFPEAEYSHCAFGPLFEKTALPSGTSEYADIDETITKVWGSSGYSLEVELLDGWPAGTTRMRIADLGSKQKVYTTVLGNGSGAPGSVTASTLWRTSARYRIENRN